MASPVPDITILGQIEFLEDTLRRTRLRYESVQNARLDARLAFEQAKRTLDALDAEAQSLDATMAGLKTDISSRRQELEQAAQEVQTARVRRILARFPRELLRCIFLEAMRHVEDVWPDDELWGHSFDDAHSLLPFALSAVNREWREVALHTADLWSFVGVGSLDACASDWTADVAYVQLLLTRSKKRALDIFLAWPDCEWTKSPQYADILAAVGRHTHRWRRVTITFPKGTPEQALQVLRLPMPALEGFGLRRAAVDDDMASSTTPSTYLPFCPNLRRIYNDLLFVVPRTPLAHLTRFTGSVASSSSDDIWTLLLALPSIERFSLDFASDERDALPDTSLRPLKMPHLRSLGLTGWCDRFAPWADLLELPALDELLIESEALGAYASLFDKAAGTLGTLTLHAVPDGAAFPAAHLAKLRKLRHLVLLNCTALDADYCAALASAGLASISLTDSKLDEDSAAHVSALMQRLHAGSAGSEEGAVAFKLSVDQPDDVPEWLTQQYNFITGEGNASDGEEEEGAT